MWNDIFGFGGYGFGIGIGLVVFLIAIWEIAWKGFGLWHAAQQKETAWFIAILIFNTLGILPILYIYVFSKKKNSGSTNTPVNNG
jgi:H+/Cl- antiporter ClcA